MTAGIEVEMLATGIPRIRPDRKGSEGSQQTGKREKDRIQTNRETFSSPGWKMKSISLGSAKVPEPTETENGLDSITGGGVTDPSLVAVMEPNDPLGLNLWRAVG